MGTLEAPSESGRPISTLVIEDDCGAHVTGMRIQIQNTENETKSRLINGLSASRPREDPLSLKFWLDFPRLSAVTDWCHCS